jgi:hypothetical protein
MTAIVAGVSFGIRLESRGGLRAGSSPISLMSVTGRGPVMGCEPVQRTSMLALKLSLVQPLPSGPTATLQLLDLEH